MAGFVYVLSNKAMPGLYKIGFTERDIVERIAELSSSTGVPTPFEPLFALQVSNPTTAERLCHETLAPYRYNESREFFRLE